jgi:epoxyqueuosine reductase
MTDPEKRIKQLGRGAGFNLVRIAQASALHVERARYLEWIAAGRHGEMRWITPERAERACDPEALLEDARSVVSVGLSYWPGRISRGLPAMGRIAKYAVGVDYHEVMGARLRSFAEEVASEFGSGQRWFVDTGPPMDKAWAARSGLGWYGKNTNIITEEFGSFVLLGELLSTLKLKPDAPLQQDCGACRLCQLACPTGALGPDYTLDSRKCISYLTIELRGPIPLEFRPLIGDWVFGCDICQDVCPPAVAPYLADAPARRAWAQDTRALLGRIELGAPGVGWGELPAPETPNPLHPGELRPSVDLIWLLRLSHDQYLHAFRGTAIKRAKDWMLRRNAAVALGNVGDAASLEPLGQALRDDEHPVVRGHAAWALGRLARRRIGALETGAHLAGAIAVETHHAVRAEILRASEDITLAGRR